MGSTSAEHPPAEGYGVVPIGKRWMPVKWAPEAGAGAYRGLRDDDRAAPDGTPKTFATFEEAARFTWVAQQAASVLLRARRDAEESGDPPRRIAAKAPKRTKPGKRETRPAPQGRSRPDAGTLAPDSTPDSILDSIMVPVLTPPPTPRLGPAMTPTVVPILTPEVAALQPARAGGTARTGARDRQTSQDARASA